MTYDEAVAIAHSAQSNVMSLDELFNAYTKFNALVENTPKWMDDNQSESWQRAMHGAIGMCTESAEILDLFKKELYGKNKPLAISHVREELGDNLFYMVVIMRAFDIDIRRVVAENVMKLANRYIEKMKTHV